VNLPVATLLGDASLVNTVWTWDVGSDSWKFYSPTMTSSALLAYAADKKYGVLSEIKAGEGYWVNAKQAFDMPLPIGTAITATQFQVGQSKALASGWNLAAIGNELSPSEFNRSIGMEPPIPLVILENLTSLWAWNNLQGKWYFYSPSLEKQGGDVLRDYSTSKGYLDFSASGKLLGPGVGFWVKKP